MNAIQFIKDHGVEKAREVVEGAPNRANWYQAKGKYSNDLYSCNHELYGEAIMLSDLKRLVDSIDLITSYGGIINAQHEIKYLDLDWDYDSPRVTRLKQAIADYESIGGEHV